MKFNPLAVGAAHDALISCLNLLPEPLTVPELIILYGNLGYTIGASIAGFQEKGPAGKELADLLDKNPNHPGLALMVQGEMITQWYYGLQQLEEQMAKGELSSPIVLTDTVEQTDREDNDTKQN